MFSFVVSNYSVRCEWHVCFLGKFNVVFVLVLKLAGKNKLVLVQCQQIE